LISVSNFIRSNSATGVLLFLLLFVFLTQKANKKLLVYTYVVLFAGYLISNLFIASLKKEKTNYLNSINATKVENFVDGHVFWHTAYIGLGFLNNHYKIEYNDNCGFARAKLLQPNVIYLSNEYENLLKNEVINLLKTDPWFIAKTILSKFGVIMFYLLIFSNIGLIYIFNAFKSLTFNIPVLICLIFNLSFPLIAMPFPSYLMGTVCSVIILSIISMDIENNKNKLINNNLKSD
jgi:ABC-type multidrug transport system fused ATPase/permease subunit